MTAVSESLRADTYRVLNVRHEVEVIPNFIDPVVYDRAQYPCRRSAFVQNGEKLLIHVSNFRPVKRARAQRFSWPRRQYVHSPHVHPSQGTPTRSPPAGPATRGPTPTTIPTTWWPGTRGSFGSVSSPSTMCRSVRQSPHACTRRRTWPGPGAWSGWRRDATGCAGWRGRGCGASLRPQREMCGMSRSDA